MLHFLCPPRAGWEEGTEGERKGLPSGAQSDCAPRSVGRDPDIDHLRSFELKTAFLRISGTVDIGIPVTELGFSLPFFVCS